MDPSEIRELIELVSRSNFSEFELERDDFKLKLVKQQTQAVALPQAQAPAPAAAVVATPDAGEAPAASAEVDDGTVVMASPIVGTFYRSPGPEAPAFVEAGARITKGQVLCIVEAMKVMNEIEAEIDAEVVEVLVANGQPVEYGEALFRLRPTH